MSQLQTKRVQLQSTAGVGRPVSKLRPQKRGVHRLEAKSNPGHRKFSENHRETTKVEHQSDHLSDSVFQSFFPSPPSQGEFQGLLEVISFPPGFAGLN